MTVNKLYEILFKLVKEGHGRKDVYIDKPSFSDNRESDGCVILPVGLADLKTFHRIADDGGIALKADGTERYITACVLTGDGESSFPSAEAPRNE